MKIGGRYSSLFYPQKGAIVGWLLLIVVLYAPFFVQLVLFRRQLDLTASQLNQKKGEALAFTVD